MPRRSPVIIGLLFAATLAVDAVAVVWGVVTGGGEASGTLFFALTFSQVGLLCVWAVLKRHYVGWRWVAPFAGGLAVASLTVLVELIAEHFRGPPDAGEVFLAFTSLYWINVAVTLATLWILKPTRLFPKKGQTRHRPTWRFSVGNLLILMTGTSVLLMLLAGNELIAGAAAEVSTIVVGNVVLLVAVVLACSMERHWLLRLGTSLAAAIAIGAVSWQLGPEIASIRLVASYLIQTIVLFAWLELGRILPLAHSAHANDDTSRKSSPAPPE